MNEFADSETIGRWIVCESAHRWLTAIRRFAPMLMPPPLVVDCLSADRKQLPGILGNTGPAVVLWEVRRESLAAACDCLARTAITTPQVLQLAAGPGLSGSEKVVLSEFRCAATIRHPEDLPHLARMIHGYFAMPGKHLD